MYNFISMARRFSDFISMCYISKIDFFKFYQFNLISIEILTIFNSKYHPRYFYKCRQNISNGVENMASTQVLLKNSPLVDNFKIK